MIRLSFFFGVFLGLICVSPPVEHRTNGRPIFKALE